MARTLVLLSALALVGCSSDSKNAPGQQRGNEAVLYEVGGLIQMYSGEAGRGPKKAGDFAKFQNGYPLGFKAVQSGEVVVVWGAKMAGEGEAASAPEDVIAYEKKVPTEGGWVLLQNGKTKELTAAEFASAPKAK